MCFLCLDKIELQVDLREVIDLQALLDLRKPRDKERNKRVPVEYSIVLQLDGEKVEYRLYFDDVVKKTKFSLSLASGSVDLTTLQELGQCPRRIHAAAEIHAQTDSSDEASLDNNLLDESITDCLNLTSTERAQQEEEERPRRRHRMQLPLRHTPDDEPELYGNRLLSQTRPPARKTPANATPQESFQDALDEGRSMFDGPDSDSTLTHEPSPLAGSRYRREQHGPRRRTTQQSKTSEMLPPSHIEGARSSVREEDIFKSLPGQLNGASPPSKRGPASGIVNSKRGKRAKPSQHGPYHVESLRYSQSFSQSF